MRLLRWIWRMMNDLCTECGHTLNIVYGMGPRWARRSNGNYVWCSSCSTCTDDEWED